MELLTKLYVKAREEARGQTMTEYALILAAVAVVVFVGYQTMGTTIQNLLNSVDSSLEAKSATAGGRLRPPASHEEDPHNESTDEAVCKGARGSTRSDHDRVRPHSGGGRGGCVRGLSNHGHHHPEPAQQRGQQSLTWAARGGTNGSPARIRPRG
jgi:Flp pilus assembly pilin Flp